MIFYSKKALILFLFTSMFLASITTYGMEKPTNPNEPINFLTKNGDTITLKRKIAEQSKTIFHLLADVDDQAQEAIPLPNISTATLRGMKPLLKKNFKGILSQENFKMQSDDTLLKLIQATNYLDCPTILNECSDALAQRTFSKNNTLYISNAFNWAQALGKKLPNELLTLMQHSYLKLKKSYDLFEYIHNPQQTVIKPISLTNNDGQIRSVHYDIDGKKITTLIDSDAVCHWDIETTEQTTLIDKRHWQSLVPDDNKRYGNKMYFETSAYSPDGSTYATGGSDTVCIWDLNKKELINYKKLAWQFRPMCMSYHPTLKRLAVGSGHSGKVIIFDIETMDIMHTLKTNDIWVKNIHYAPNGKTLATSNIAGGNDCIRIWDPELSSCLKTIEVEHKTFQSPIICYSPDSQLLACAAGNKITIYDATNNYTCIKDIKRCEKPLKNDNNINSIQYSSDGNYLICGFQDGTIKFWETNNYTCIKTLSYERPIWSTALNTRTSKMATISPGKTYPEGLLALWDVSSLFLENCFKELNFEELLLVTKIALAKKNNTKFEVCPLHSDELDAETGIKISNIYNNLPTQLKEKLAPYFTIHTSCKCTFLPVRVRTTAKALPKSRFGLWK